MFSLENIETIGVFRNVDAHDPGALAMPMKTSYRSCTDIPCIILFVFAVILVVIAFCFCLTCVDLRHFGLSDSCGNFCGQKNKVVPNVNCSGEDYSSKTFLQYTESINNNSRFDLRTVCVEKCNETFVICGHSCWPKEENTTDGSENSLCDNQKILDEIRESLKTYWWGAFIAVCLIIGMCLIVMLLLRFYSLYFLWGAIIFISAIFICFIILQGIMFASQQNTSNLVLLILLGGLGLLPLCLMCCFYQYIELAALLIAETTKIFSDMPCIICVGLGFCVLEGLTIIGTTALQMTLVTCQSLEESANNPGFYSWVIREKAIIAVALSLFLCLWMLFIWVGCSYVIFGDAIAIWYFTRNKSLLGEQKPLGTAIYTLICFHLGSVFFGALLVTIFEIIKSILEELARQDTLRFCVQCILDCIGDLLKYFTAIAYIQVGINGQSFCHSGKRAFYLAIANIINLAVVKCAISCIMYAVGAAICIITAAVIYFLTKSLMITAFAFIFGIIIVGFFANLFSIVNDCLLMCYFEDIAGKYSPPYMSDSLRNFMNTAKPIVGERDPDSRIP